MVSVITPVYNSEKSLSRAIESVLSQTYEDIEYILVDDGSTDNSLSIIETYAQKDKRIKYFSRPNSGNPKIPRDFALSQSKGEYIVWVDSDDFATPDLIQVELQTLQRMKADVCACTCIAKDSEDNKLWQIPIISDDLLYDTNYTGLEIFEKSISSPQIHMCGTMMKRELLEKALEIDFGKNLYINSDERDFYITLLNSPKVVFVKAEYNYLMNENSITHIISPRLLGYVYTDEQISSYLQENLFTHVELRKKWEKHRLHRLFTWGIAIKISAYRYFFRKNPFAGKSYLIRENFLDVRKRLGKLNSAVYITFTPYCFFNVIIWGAALTSLSAALFRKIAKALRLRI